MKNKKNNKKGFTLAELLIVVAIIAVLVAIAIPIFSAQLEKSRQATDLANIRAAYAEAMVAALDSDTGVGEVDSVEMRTHDADWGKIPENTKIGNVVVNTTNVPVAQNKKVHVKVENETVTFTTVS